MLWIEIIPLVEVVDLEDKPVMCTDDKEKQLTITMFEFIRGRLADQQWGQNWAWGDAQTEIKTATKEAEKAKARWLGIERTDYDKLKVTVETPHPQTPYNAAIMHNVRPFRKSILNPKDEKPKDENDDEGEAKTDDKEDNTAAETN